jgi:hypothetical protein
MRADGSFIDLLLARSKLSSGNNWMLSDSMSVHWLRFKQHICLYFIPVFDPLVFVQTHSFGMGHLLIVWPNVWIFSVQ